MLPRTPGPPAVSIYNMKDTKGSGARGVVLQHTMANKQCTSLHWSPSGRFLLLAGLAVRASLLRLPCLRSALPCLPCPALPSCARVPRFRPLDHGCARGEKRPRGRSPTLPASTALLCRPAGRPQRRSGVLGLRGALRSGGPGVLCRTGPWGAAVRGGGLPGAARARPPWAARARQSCAPVDRPRAPARAAAPAGDDAAERGRALHGARGGLGPHRPLRGHHRQRGCVCVCVARRPRAPPRSHARGGCWPRPPAGAGGGGRV